MNFLPHWKYQLSLIAIYLGMFILNGILIWLRVFEDLSEVLQNIGIFFSLVGCFTGFIYVLKKSDLLWSQPKYIRNYLLFLILPILFLITYRQNDELGLVFFYVLKIRLGIWSTYPPYYPILLGRCIFHIILPIMTVIFIPGVFHRKKKNITDLVQRKFSIQNVIFCFLLYYQLWTWRINTGFFDEFGPFLFYLGFQTLFILGVIMIFWTPRVSHLIYLIIISILLTIVDLSFFSHFSHGPMIDINYLIRFYIPYFIIAFVIFFLCEFASVKNWINRLKNYIVIKLRNLPLSSSSSSSEILVKKCIFCHSVLDAEKISALTTLDFIFCPVCGKKIMKHEIYPINEEELLAEHQAVLEKLDKTPSPSPSLQSDTD